MKRAAFAFLFALLGITPTAVRADRPAAPTSAVDDARHHFQRGIAFYKDADYRSALVEFQEAYREAPNYRLLYNVGQTEEQLGDFAGAVAAFRRYLAEGGEGIGASRRAEVDASLSRLDKHVATLGIAVSEDDADLTAEGERRLDLGKSPLTTPVLLNAGEWTIIARKTGYDAAQARVTVAGGDQKVLRLTLTRPVEQAAPAKPEAVPAKPEAAPVKPGASIHPLEPAPTRSSAPVWVGVAATGALGVAAGVTGVLALGAKSDYDTQLARFGTTLDDIAAARTRTRNFALATDLLGGAAVVAAVVTVIVYFTSRHGPKSLDASVAFDGVGVRW